MCEWQDNDFDEKLTCQNWKRWRPLEEVAEERLEESGTPEVHDSFLKFISMFCAKLHKCTKYNALHKGTNADAGKLVTRLHERLRTRRGREEILVQTQECLGSSGTTSFANNSAAKAQRGIAPACGFRLRPAGLMAANKMFLMRLSDEKLSYSCDLVLQFTSIRESLVPVGLST